MLYQWLMILVRMYCYIRCYMSNNVNKRTTSKMIRLVFGIIMIIIYVGMGVLMLSGYFFWMHDLLRIPGSIILMLYGLWRAYRLYKGIGSKF